MKKRVLSRILTVVLVCTMLLGLVGFAPMVETLSGSQQTIAAVDGSTGDIKDTPDAGGTDKDTGDTGDAGKEDPAPKPEPGKEDPEPKPEPEPGKCIVTIEQPDGGTITCKQLPEDGQVEKDTKLTFTVSPEKAEEAEKGVVSSELVAVRVNGKALDINKKGEFTVTITENTTISAEFFGIRSIKVWDADKWTQSKNVTIETIGSVSSMSYQNPKGENVAITGNTFVVEDSIGKEPVEYKITVNGKEAAEGKTATADAEVKLVDSEPPKLESKVENVKNNNDYALTSDGDASAYLSSVSCGRSKTLSLIGASWMSLKSHT